MAYDPDIRIRHGAHLPHWSKEGAVYAVTFRLADSLPQGVLEVLIAEREALLQKMRETPASVRQDDVQRAEEMFSKRVSGYLDAGYGHCWLAREDIASVVAGALRHFDGDRYMLYAWCIMPNHVHVVVEPITHSLPDILHSWKSFSANACNKLLGRKGAFWQVEYFDHLIRNHDDFECCVNYTWHNPEKAGFVDWKWRGRTGFPAR